jgi:hypothetical protein
MDARKLGMGAAIAGVGALAFRSCGPKQMHEHCQSMCAEKFGGAAESDEQEAPAEHGCCPPAAPDDAAVADDTVVA